MWGGVKQENMYTALWKVKHYIQMLAVINLEMEE